MNCNVKCRLKRENTQSAQAKTLRACHGTTTLGDIEMQALRRQKVACNLCNGNKSKNLFAVRYQDNGENHTIYFNTCPDNYPPHMNFNNRKWCRMLEEMITGNRTPEPVRTGHRVLVGV